MTREYELKRRAEQMEQTRRRIVEAAIELHETLGPARTTVSAIAERAGVQRQTYYRYFPDTRSIFEACSGLYMERNPLPDAAAWRAVADPMQRVRSGLSELYGYYLHNEAMLTSVIRDAGVDPLTREMVGAFVAPALTDLRAALAEGFQGGASAPHLLAVLDVALDFNTWRLLVHVNGLSDGEAADVMAEVVRCGGRPSTTARDENGRP